MAIEKLHHVPGSGSLHGLTYADGISLLQTRVKATQERLKEVEAALNRCHEYRARDIETVSEQRIKILELEDLIQKQKTTISNQSKAIADPKTIRIRQSTVPVPIFPLTPSTTTQPRPTVRLPHSNIPSSASPYSPSVFAPSLPSIDLPVSIIPQGNLTSLKENSKSSLGGKEDNLPPNTWSLGSSFDVKTVIPLISARLQSLFSTTQMFGHMYTNFPSIQFDSQLNPQVKEYVMSISDKIHASTLLGNPCTRLCVVSKAINFNLVHEILQPTVVQGFDAQIDRETKEIQKYLTTGMLSSLQLPLAGIDELSGIDTPAVVRHSLLIARAHHIQAVVKPPKFSEFNQNNTHSHMEKLWRLIAPLTHDPLNQYQAAWMDLQDILIEAQALAIALYSLPFEYSFKFPAVNEKFEPGTMVNGDLLIGGDPQTVKQNCALVRLGVTPTISIQDNSTAPVNVGLVGRAKVLLRPPP
ncbi:hypothetical protein BDV26DRAFT_262810 [Aspergillus bertholletiae]|uniref:Uncharacterized protein n=1 Tax=Aspergillus bertholletiae TaxID=1226010 RepID=A0A5N7B7W0_9EURO|nr:hypothetical protein BDV26DRAFT_262810 [Aspergillus bertholletiae]